MCLPARDERKTETANSVPITVLFPIDSISATFMTATASLPATVSRAIQPDIVHALDCSALLGNWHDDAYVFHMHASTWLVAM